MPAKMEVFLLSPSVHSSFFFLSFYPTETGLSFFLHTPTPYFFFIFTLRMQAFLSSFLIILLLGGDDHLGTQAWMPAKTEHYRHGCRYSGFLFLCFFLFTLRAQVFHKKKKDLFHKPIPTIITSHGRSTLGKGNA